jgi:hypothetical protein
VLNGDWEEAGREREKKEVCRKERNEEFFFINEFVKLSTIAPHHFADLVAESDGKGFWLFG